MGRLIREHDWASSALGPVDGWPQSLRVALRLLLSANVPMVLWWGDHLLMFYNNSYRDAMAPGCHPQALGLECGKRSDPIWKLIGPSIQSIMLGKGPLSGFDTAIPVAEDGDDRTYWTYDLSPIDLGDAVGGVIGMVKEVSMSHQDDEELNRISTHLMKFFEYSPGFICVLSGPEHVYEFVNLEYRALMGDRNYIGRSVRDVVPEVEGQGFFELLDNVYRTGETYTGKDLHMTFRKSEGQELIEVNVSIVYKALSAPSGEIYGIFVEGIAGPVGPEGASVPHVLTDREREVLNWIALGKTAGETATILSLSKRTCETHIYSAARKLHAVNSIQTVVEAIRRGELKL